jgi:TPP-dependent pyruvate/acetoin dehydrogenase alpha subunit
MVTKEDLIAFEDDIAKAFNEGKIKAPVHLSSGNEDHTVKVFENIHSKDWVCGAWRNHFMCLLKGVPKEDLKRRILNGKSMVMCIPEHRIICSSIVGGIPSIATGIAWGEKLKGEGNKVWCFVGDMSAATGAFNEAYRYSIAQNLPITWIIEDNGKSVETPTNDVWGDEHFCGLWHRKFGELIKEKLGSYWYDAKGKFIYYQYTNTKYPHAGAGQRINF